MTFDETYEAYDDLIDQPETSRRGRRQRRRKKKSRFGSILAVVLSVAVVGGGGYAIYNAGRDWVGGLFASAPDFEGPGHGEVAVTVPSGATGRTIGTLLEEAGVVASVDAFVNAANENPASQGIQPGDYTLMLEMPASDVITAMLDSTQVVGRVTIPEGFRVEQIVARIAAETDFSESELEEILAEPDDLDLPGYADDAAEGFLFPATYDLRSDTTARSLVGAMISRFNRAAADLELVDGAAAAGYDPREIVVMASIIQREVRHNEDMPNVAEVIYNRMSGECTAHGVPVGLLQMDSTVHYLLDDYDSVFTSDEERAIDDPYNTYLHAGLPPGPIAAPGDEALSAALNPSGEGFCYFVTVDIETGETKFATTLAEHQANVAESRS